MAVSSFPTCESGNAAAINFCLSQRDQKSRLKLAHEIISASLIMHQNIGDICCLGNHVTLAGFLKFTVSRFAILQEAKLFFSPPEIV
ncbi:hypothetical protein Y1Q_0001467 [Alligator mississippiensis]|uniref:Uncharacterized protein n=1 Tax=Alligator mississippiensis TaxID=8496 RepID=A0A151M9L7_ALLMI|nr:hypothetical protein Y1Q_0001467 [Alligator mississippiensis]